MSLIWLHGLMRRKGRLKPVPLKNVSVASPCPLRWEQMIGNERVRHCSECNLNVYNLSALTAHEAEELIASREGRLCVRFYQRADGTVLTQDCPNGFRSVVRRVSRIAGTALSALLSVGFAAGQATSKNEPPSTKGCDSEPTPQDLNHTGVALTLVDPSGGEIPGAHVTVQNKHGKVRLTGTTNGQGRVLIPVPSAGKYTISVQVHGFKSYKKTLRVNENKMTVARIALRLDEGVWVVVGELTSGPVRPNDGTITTDLAPDVMPAQVGYRPATTPLRQ